MHPDLTKLKQALKAQQITEPKRIINFASDLISEVHTRELLYIAIDKGILLAFMQESNPDTFFVNRMKTKLVQDYHINETAAGKAIEYCLFLVDKNPDSNKSESAQLLEINQNKGTFTDPRDCNIYKWIRIGAQVWMAENLRYIPHVSPCEEQGGIWVYDYEGKDVNAAKQTEKYKKYGCLYNWETACKVAPDGWHLPSDDEWETLALYVNSKKGPFQKRGGDWEGMGTYLKATTGSVNNGNGNDYFGFSGLPGGYRYTEGPFDDAGDYGFWWSSTEASRASAYYRSLIYSFEYVARDTHPKRMGFSVRCIKDK